MIDEHARRAIKLRELIARYGAMRRLNGYTRQNRGTAFNELIADMLNLNGIPARFSVRGEGEIDVAFSINGIRYVLEAKWRRDKASAADIAKLNMRVEQRFISTIGVFVAVNGYSQNALRAVNFGRRMLMILLTQSHIEAMLSGLIPPDELFNLLLDKLSYEGGTLHEVEDLFDRLQKPPSIRFDVPPTLRDAVRKAAPGVSVDVLIHDLPFEYSGLACDAQGKLLVNLPEGVAKVDTDSQSARWAVPLPRCYGHVLARDGRIFFRREFALGVWENGTLKALDGGFSGNVILLATDSGDVLAIDTGGLVPNEGTRVPEGQGVDIVRLGESLGDSERLQTRIRGAYLGDAISMTPGTIAAIGGDSLEMIDAESGQAEGYPHGLLNTFSIEKYDDSHVLVVANGQTVAMMSVDGKTVHPIVEIGFSGAVSELCRSADAVYYMYSTYSQQSGLPRGVVARISVSESRMTID